MDKSELRKSMMNKRDSMPASIRLGHSKIIMDKLRHLSIYKDARLIFVYVSFRSEVETHSFINQALLDGKRIAVPLTITNGKLLLPCEITSLEELTVGTWGILEPDKDNIREIDYKEIDLALVPGLAFDPFGNRLGYGAGYYDRFLPNLRNSSVLVGMGFDFQLIDQVQAGPFDVPMDSILTNEEFRYCSH